MDNRSSFCTHSREDLFTARLGLEGFQSIRDAGPGPAVPVSHAVEHSTGLCTSVVSEADVVATGRQNTGLACGELSSQRYFGSVAPTNCQPVSSKPVPPGPEEASHILLYRAPAHSPWHAEGPHPLEVSLSGFSFFKFF